MMWTRHQFAPAMPMQKVVDRAVAGRVTDGFLVGSLEIMDVQHFAGAGRFGKTRQQRLFFGHRHILVLASTIWLGLERLDATVISDTPIADAIAGCAIPLSRNSTIWMR